MQPSQRKVTATARAMSSRTFAPSRSGLLASPAEGHVSLDRVGAELADFLHAGRQLFAIIVPIEHHVGILHIEQFAKTFNGMKTKRTVK
jgi:hypothetical protein